MDEIQIKQASAADADAIGQVHVDSWRSSYAGLLPAEVLQGLSVERRSAQWRERIEQGLTSSSGDRVFVARRSDGRIVGFAAAGPDREAGSGFDGELYAIYLLEEYKGSGIGRRLFLEAGEWLAALGYESLRVWVLTDNPARHFYERLGGEPAGEKTTEVAGTEYPTVAYGWRNLTELLRLP